VASDPSNERDKPATGPDNVVPVVDTSGDPSGSNADNPLTRGEYEDRHVSRTEYENRHRRLVFAVLIAFMFTLIANGGGWTLYQHVQNERSKDTYNACLDVRNRSVESGQAIAQFARAAELDHDTNQAKLWASYSATLGKAQLPTCVKP
jgi:hypothetical protein